MSSELDEGRGIVLLGCVKTKRAEPAPARDLYASPLWRARRGYAETSGSPWFILSAKYGLVEPAEVLAPYEATLSQRSASERRSWGAEAVADLEARRGELRGAAVEIHAGAPYRNAVWGPLKDRGAVPVNPLVGLGIGRQLAWYDARARREGMIDSDGVAARLADRSASLPAREWPGELSGLDRCGLYSWWVDAAGARQLSAGLGHEIRAGLIYAGLAGATKWPSGRRSKATLASRIGGNHIRGRIQGSTFRLTLAAALLRQLDLEVVGPKRLGPDSERRLSDWIRGHLAVVALPSPDPDGLGSLEAAVLERLDPPLNLDHRPLSPLRGQLSRLRAAIARGRTADSDEAALHPAPEPASP